MNGVIPFTMKLVLFQIHSLNFLIRHLPTGRISPTIQTAGHLEPFAVVVREMRFTIVS